MNKYLVFRLEKPLTRSGGFGISGVVTVSCFELVKEFEVKDMPYWRKGDEPEEANSYASEDSKDHGVRTVVIKGTVFGGD